MTMLIQEAQPRDLPGIVALRERNLGRYAEKKLPGLEYYPMTIWNRCASAIGNPMARIYVALDDQLNVVGCFFLRISPSPLHDGQLIAHQEVFVVEPDRRGEGIGDLLLERGEQWAKDNGCVAVVLAYRDGEPLQEWFGVRGYQPLERYIIKQVG